MQSKIQDAIFALAENIKKEIPKSFEKFYYEKMSYSDKNKIIDLDREILLNSISFEIAFMHIIMYVFNKCCSGNKGDYSIFLESLDRDKIFCWYVMEDEFIEELDKLDFQEFVNICKFINQHDKFINKEIKKIIGQFYTPEDIVKNMIMEISDNLKKAGDGELVVDPACGTGVFLVEIINTLRKTNPTTDPIRFVERNLFAYDVNPFAVLASKVNIAYALISNYPEIKKEILEYLTIPNPFPNIQWKNTIVESDKKVYNIIVGNPPYFKLNKVMLEQIGGYKEIIYGQPNIYSLFMYWGMQHLKVKGVMSFIVPQSIRSGLYFKKLRQKMKNFRIRSISNIDSRQNVFDRAEQAVLIICMENNPIANTKTKIRFYDGYGKINTQFEIQRSRLMLDEKSNNIFIISKKKEMYDILENVFSNSKTMCDEDSELKFSNGLYVWNQHKEDLIEQDSSAVPIIYGNNILPLKFDFSISSPNDERKKYAVVTEKTKAYVLEGKRLLIQRTTNFEKDIRIKSCIITDDFLESNKRYFLENHVNFLCGNHGKYECLDINTMYLYLGLLNSKLINFIFSCKSGNTQVSANELNSLPYPMKSNDDIAEYVAKNIINLHKVQKELDILVCQTYGLSSDETEFIINY